MMRRSVAWLTLSLLLLLPVAAFAADPQLPPAPTHYVTDTTGTLDDATTQTLDAELQSFQKKTGHHVLVWVGQTTGGEALEDWTQSAEEAWKIDKKGQSDSAILFVFMGDHQIRIDSGYSLEPVLTDAISSEIIRDTMTPKLKAGDANGAIQAGAEQMLVTIDPSFSTKTDATTATADTDSDGDQPSTFSVFLFIFGIFILISIFTSIMRALMHTKNGAWLAGTSAGAFAGSGLFGGGGGFGGGGFGGGGGGGFSGGGFGGGFGGGGASGGW